MSKRLVFAVFLLSATHCGHSLLRPAPDAAGDAAPGDAPPTGIAFCSLGTPVNGATVPPGFCIRRFAGPTDGVAMHSPVREPRTMGFAPNGDLFVGAPASAGAGGGTGGPGAILVLSDDDHDGVAEVHTFLGGIPDVHGIAVGTDAIYFTGTRGVSRTPYTVGQRTAMGTALFAMETAQGRMTHGLARSVGGMMFFSTGRDASTCPDTGSGFIDQIRADGSTMVAARGFRNPMYLRCHFHDEVCMATELGDDGGGAWGAREKLLIIRPNTDYGSPCCATTNMPAPGVTESCASVTTEEAQFPVHDTPFGMDWERGIWPAPYANVICVGKHGSFYSVPEWQGAGIVCAPTDPQTHAPSGPFRNFVDGFGPNGGELERGADVAFAPDGRMFFSDDFANAIYWVAPVGLQVPPH